MATNLTTTTSPSAVATSFFAPILAKIEAAGTQLETAAKAELVALVKSAETVLGNTLAALAPELDKDADGLTAAVTVAADAFMAAQLARIPGGTAALPAAEAQVNSAIQTTEAVLKAAIDSWVAARAAQVTAAGAEPAVQA